MNNFLKNISLKIVFTTCLICIKIKFEKKFDQSYSLFMGVLL